MSLNVEGHSMLKCEYLSRLLKKHDMDVLHLQKTHLRKAEACSNYEIPNYTLVENLNHKQYGIATYAKSPEPIILVNSEITNENIFRINILQGNLAIVNVYKPPKTDWPDPPLPDCQRPALIAGDFKSKHKERGYRANDKAGEKLRN